MNTEFKNRVEKLFAEHEALITPMQISLTRRVKEKLEDVYSFVPRLPIYFGQKKALIFYLHRRLK